MEDDSDFEETGDAGFYTSRLKSDGSDDDKYFAYNENDDRFKSKSEDSVRSASYQDFETA